MATERVELPNGTLYQELGEINAQVPVPAGWHTTFMHVPNNYAYSVSREDLSLTGMYKVGMSLQALENVSQALGQIPSDVAREMINNIPARPASDVVEFESNGLVFFRRFFWVASDEYPIEIPWAKPYPIDMYSQVVANDRTNRLYSMNFDTPSSEWRNYRETGKLMIEGTVLDPNF